MAPVADVLENIIFYSFNVAGQGLPIVLVVLGGTAIFLTIYFKFLNLRSIGLAFRTARESTQELMHPARLRISRR